MKKNNLNKEYYYEKNDFIGYSFILSYIFLFLLVIYGIIVINNIIIKIALIIILGFFQAGFNQGKHEFLHKTAIKSKFLNTIFWYLFSLPIWVNPHYNKDFHLGHHKKLGTPEDPELNFKVRQGCSFGEVMLDKLKHPFLLDLIVANFNALFLNKFADYVTEKNKKNIKIDAFLLFLFHGILIGLSIYTNTYMYLIAWYLILEYIGFNILCVFDIAEHRGCDISDFYNDSRTVKSNFFITFITWFNNYHSVHHTDSLEKAVTFYKRKKYFDNINKFETKEVEKSYIGFLNKLRKFPEKFKN